MFTHILFLYVIQMSQTLVLYGMKERKVVAKQQVHPKEFYLVFVSFI